LKTVIAILAISVVAFFTQNFFRDYQYQHKKEAIESSFFPSLNKIYIQSQTCRPQFVYHSDKQLIVYCDSLSSAESAVREELRKAVKFRLEKWAVENQYSDRFLYVSFIDEVTTAPTK